MTRWIAQSVDMLDHPIVGMDVPPPPAADKTRHAQSPLVAWQDLLRSARWSDGAVAHKGKSINLKRGEFLAGRAHWAKRWNWGEQAVRSFFSRLSENKMIEICNQSSGHTANVARICNYSKYQSIKTDAQPDQKPEPNQSPTSGQPEGNQNSTRNTTLVNEESASAGASSTAINAGHGVMVNCETIKHPNFTISIGAIELGIAGRLTKAEVKDRCTSHALQWAAEIEAGANPRDVVPSKIANFLSHSIMSEINSASIAEVRKARFKPYSTPKSSEAVPHRVSTETRLFVRPAGYDMGEVSNG